MPESNKRRKLSLKRKKKGPTKELFPPEGRPLKQEDTDIPNFDLGFDVEDEVVADTNDAQGTVMFCYNG